MNVSKQTRSQDPTAAIVEPNGANPVAGEVRLLGFLTGQIRVPDDFDRLSRAEIAQLFDGVDEDSAGATG